MSRLGIEPTPFLTPCEVKGIENFCDYKKKKENAFMDKSFFSLPKIVSRPYVRTFKYELNKI